MYIMKKMHLIIKFLYRFNFSTITQLSVYENLACLKWNDRRGRTLGDTKLRFENSKGKGILIHSTFRHSERLLISRVSRLPTRFPLLLPLFLGAKARGDEYIFVSFPPFSFSLFFVLFFFAGPAYSARWRFYVSKCMQKTEAPRAS